MIIVTGTITTAPADAPALLADLRSGIAKTLTEDGCLFYTFAMEDAETGTVLAAERWRDDDALAVHLATPEVAALFGRWVGRLEFAVFKYDATNERPLP